MSALFDAVYLLLLVVLSPAIAWVAWKKGKYRDGLNAKLVGCVPVRVGSAPCVWLHAVSVGEINLLSTIVTRLESERPDVDLYITTTTRTGFELAQQKYSRHVVSYCPLDFSWAVRRAIRRIRPNVLLLAELELWPNLIRSAARAQVSVGLVNARLSRRSFSGYRRIRWIIEPTLNRLQWAASQTEEYADRLVALGMAPHKVVVTGSIKYDGVETDRLNSQANGFRSLLRLQAGQPVFLAGSTQAPEEELAIETFRRLANEFPQLRLIIVPRHPERFDEVARLLDRSSLGWTRRSQLRPGDDVQRILLVDTVGELSAWWALADVAFVGGSMGQRGGQNMIEPAAYGSAVCFGPNTENFKDVVQQMLENRAAVVVQDLDEMHGFVERCLRDREFQTDQGRRARSLVLRNQGAIDQTVKMIHLLLPDRPVTTSDHPLAPNSAKSSARTRKSA